MDTAKAASKVEDRKRDVALLMVANAYEQDDISGEWGGVRVRECMLLCGQCEQDSRLAASHCGCLQHLVALCAYSRKLRSVFFEAEAEN
jgi:hypothetical protein